MAEFNFIVEEDLKYIHEGFKNKVELNGASILLTGCGGFLGYYFLHYFLRYSKELNLKKVIGLDNFLMSKKAWLSKLEDQYTDVFELVNFDIVNGDFADVEGVKDCNFIIHMASIASPTFYRQYPIETLDANIWGLRRLLELYKNESIKGLLFFSSSEIYGDPAPDKIPTSEDYHGNVSCIGPRACYDEAKRFGETLCYNFALKYSMPICIARPFNNFGPGMSVVDKRVPADFANSVILNKDIEIFSDGSPTRTFCYIADAILGYLKVMTYGKFDVFNIGIDKPEVSIGEFAKINAAVAKEVFGFELSVKFSPPPDQDYLTHNPNRRCPNIDKARELLEYNPKFEVEEGVWRFLTFLKEEGC